MTQTALASALGYTQPYVSKLIARGMPDDTIENAQAWLAENLAWKTGAGAEADDPDYTPPPPPEIPSATDIDNVDLPGVLARVRTTERVAYALLSKVMQREQPDSGLLNQYQRSHAAAVRVRVETEEAVLRVQQERRQLASVEKMKETVETILGPLAAGLENFAKSVAPMANPGDPGQAEKAIEAKVMWLREQIEAARKSCQTSA